MQNAFAFEIHVVDQRITAVRRARHARKLAFDIGAHAGRGFVEHFGEGFLQTGDQELRLEIDSVREKLPEFAHLCGILRAGKFRSRLPRTSGRLIEPHWNHDLAFLRVGEKFWKTFLEWSAHALGIPDEMSDAKGCEIFAGVPSRQARDAAVTFVLPDPFSDSKRVGIGNMNGRGGPARLDQEEQKKANAGDAVARMLMG